MIQITLFRASHGVVVRVSQNITVATRCTTAKWSLHAAYIEPFDPSLDKERFDYFCIAHGIAEAKQKALFLTRIGQTMYLKLKTWVSPKKLSDLSLDEIVVQLKSQTSAQTVEIAERYIISLSAFKKMAKV